MRKHVVLLTLLCVNFSLISYSLDHIDEYEVRYIKDPIHIDPNNQLNIGLRG